MTSHEASTRQTYSVEEAAAVLGIGRTLARRLAREGQLPGVIRLGSRYLVSKTVLQALLSATNTAAGTEDLQEDQL